MDKYFYKLQYTNNNETLTYEFPADIGGYELVYNLRNFLCGCSWTEEQVKSMLKLEEE
jgi:hypothetical protein